MFCVQMKKKMSPLGISVTLLSTSFCLFFLVKFLYATWLKPLRIRRRMASQGIKGPPYRFPHGNSKEIIQIRDESMSMSKSRGELSHDTYSRTQPHILSWVQTYGKSFLFWIGNRPQLMVMEADLVKEVLNNRERVYVKTGFHPLMRKLLGDGLVTSEGEKWGKMRKLANYAFRVDNLKNMIPEMVESAEMMLERWENHQGKEIDVHEEFRLFTSEVISRIAFGSSYIEGKNIFDMLVKFSMVIQKTAFKYKLPGFSKIWKSRDEVEADKLEKGIRDSILKVVKKREEKGMTGEVDSFGSDFLGLLLKACHDDDESKRISVDDLIDECKTIYLAGQETTTVFLSWAVLLLAIHTDWQEEARNEVHRVFGHQTPNADGIAKLKTMSMIINETLRLYPPVSGFARKNEKEARLGSLILPATMNLYITNVAIHHDTRTWGEDSHLFKPERFSEGVAKVTNGNAAAYLPFGLGPRTCVGMNLALIEAKIALSMILQRYSFTLSPAYVHSPYQLFTLRPQHGVQVMINAL